jgi:hypothetical protein
VSENLLRAINGSAGMVAIMHPRGEVSSPRGPTHTRASVWIEQELAIAAFLTQVHARQFPILAYIHKNIKREGLRDKLLLNAQPFESNEEILKHLQAVLPIWVLNAPGTPPPDSQFGLDVEGAKCFSVSTVLSPLDCGSPEWRRPSENVNRRYLPRSQAGHHCQESEG